MRERAIAVGGTVSAAPRPGDTFRVRVDLPLKGDPAVNIRVLPADDQVLIRSGFRALIDSAPDLEVVGEASDGASAVAVARATRADVVVMDIRMPDVDGVEATRRTSADDDLAGVRVLVLTTFELDEHVVDAVRAGASGFLGKGVEPQVLLDAIRTVAAGDALLSPKATRALISRYLQPAQSPVAAPASLAALTDREREVVALVAEGLSNNEIAAKFFLSPLTAKTHVNRAMMKLGARDRAQLGTVRSDTGVKVKRSGEPPGAAGRSGGVGPDQSTLEGHDDVRADDTGPSISSRVLIGVITASRIKYRQFDPARFAGPDAKARKADAFLPPRRLKGVRVRRSDTHGWPNFEVEPVGPDALPTPELVVLLSASGDATLEHPGIASTAPSDPLLHAPHLRALYELYADDLPLDDPRISPINGPMHRLRRVAIYIGSRDILVHDAERLRDRLVEAGVDVVFERYDGMPHDWMLMPVPEARRQLRHVAAVITEADAGRP